ncbi:hypothetical protein ACJMK2_000304 [Sinanodonta woodiana]|uniref:G-protein coupled receptors family 1 profile domain-containing protein n=1 Tax=Sinanodonta woodiana TaxID=1069815 RepID=A0ABD3XNU0_SINWO
MNNSSATDLLQRMNDDISIVLIPVFIYMGVLMLTGFVGNTLVCYFYGYRTKTNPTTCFIVVLAVFDVMNCIISMPLEIVDIRFFYFFPDVIACKVLRTISYVCTVSSGTILIAIATERYRKICLPFKKQITVLQAKFICVISTLIAIVISWPSIVLYSVVPVDVPVPGSETIQAYDCTTVKVESLRIYLLAFSAIQFLLFIISCITLIVLYVLIYKQLIRVKKNRNRFMSPNDNNASLSTLSTRVMERNVLEMEQNTQKVVTKVQTMDEKMKTETSILKATSTHVDQDKSGYNEEREMIVESEGKASIISPQEKNRDALEKSGKTMERISCNKSSSFTKALNSTRIVSHLAQRKSKDTNSDKYTTIMLLITVVFIVSFLPYLCLSMWQNFSKDYVVNRMSDLQIVFFSIGIRSYFLNSVLNPFIYGFFNLKFREFIASVFFGCFRVNPKGENTSESRTT